MPLPFNPPCFFSFLLPLMATFYFVHGEAEFLPDSTKEFSCGAIGFVGFPFAKHTQPHCGLVAVNCDTTPPTLQLETGGDWYPFQLVLKLPSGAYTIYLEDSKLQRHFVTHNYSNLNYTLLHFHNSPSVTFLNVDASLLNPYFHCNDSEADNIVGNYERYNCSDGYSLYYKRHVPENNPKCDAVNCTLHPSPFIIQQTNDGLTAHLLLYMEVSKSCHDCYQGGGQCTEDSKNKFHCAQGNITTGITTTGNITTWNTPTGNTSNHKLIPIIVSGALALIVVSMAIILVWQRKEGRKGYLRNTSSEVKKIKNNQDVEEFLKIHGPFALKRFSYSEVKKITNSFKNELGKGGFGSVYKGKLRNGDLVAVKVLKELKASGEEFINEVASISRTSHVNIVTLVGFCIEGNKRALVYDFMLNGSLEKFIYDNKSLMGRQLEWNMLYKISIGIARGLEYLHSGCNTRILHLDIKPHNILLDENFSPKISDFGLAKLCNKQESTVSIFGARGTIGYIAPEVVCNDIGGVSHKSDVYSYGMMVLEMVGGRRNVDVGVSRNSKIYFPHWIYTRVVLDDELGLNGVMNEEENEFARKMVIVSLWCIQTDPSTRPSMSRVVEMLEGKVEYLQIPPKPYLYSSTRSEEQHSSSVYIT